MKQPDRYPAGADHGGHGRHRLMMIACCVPMLVLAVALVATGVVGPTFLIVALACTAVMVLMMRGMHGGADRAPHAYALSKPDVTTRAGTRDGSTPS